LVPTTFFISDNYGGESFVEVKVAIAIKMVATRTFENSYSE